TRAPATGWRTALPTRPPAAAPPNPPIAAPFCVVLMLEQPRNPITSGKAMNLVSLVGSPFQSTLLDLGRTQSSCQLMDEKIIGISRICYGRVDRNWAHQCFFARSFQFLWRPYFL